MKKQFKTTDAFPEPNYTQIPNDFFKMLPEMESSEVRVTLVMMRQTFGFHRDEFKMGLDELAEAAGLSRNAAKDGAEAAEARGTFRRSNPDKQTKAEWELIIDGQSLPVTECMAEGQPVTSRGSTSDSQVRIKESIKKEKESGENSLDLQGITEQANKKVDAILAMANFPGAKTEARTSAILSYLGERFHLNTETKAWREFAKFVDNRQQKHGEKIETFVAWFYDQKNDLKYWPPSKMIEFWPSAFVKIEDTRPEGVSSGYYA